MNAQPYSASAVQARDRGGQRGRDGHRLEGDQGDDDEQSDGRRAARARISRRASSGGCQPRQLHLAPTTQPRGPESASALALGDLLGELRDDREQVADDAEVGQLEDRRLGVLVDRDDRLGGLHAGPVLDRAGDADRDVELRRDRLAGLADLDLVRVPAGVGGGAGRADRARRAESASSSTSSKFSAEPTPRPPETTIDASVSSGRAPFSSTTRSTILAGLARRRTSVTTATGSAAGAGAGSA